MITLHSVSKIYNPNQQNKVEALKGLSLSLPDNGMVFLVGESGSGKTTLLNLLAALEKPSSGGILVDGLDLGTAKEKERNRYRNEEIGIIFQSYNLLQDESVSSNICLALELQGRKRFTSSKADVDRVLAQVGLAGYGDRKISQLSGGQQQRVAIARALIKSPKRIFADEPTGNLDSETSESIMGLLKELSQTRLVVVVCHDLDLAEKYADRIITLRDGSIEQDKLMHAASMQTTNRAQWEETKKTKHLSFVRQCRFAFRNLWTIKFRLIIVILLLGFSISTASVGAIAARYNRETTRAQAYSDSGLSSVIVREKNVYELDELNNPIEQTGFMKQKLMPKDKIGGLEAISDGEYYRIYGTSDRLPETLLVTGDFSRLSEFGFRIIKGRYPQRENEKAVSLSLAQTYTKHYSYIYGSSPMDIIGKEGIVGIIDTDQTKLEDFADKVYAGNPQKDLLKHMYLEKESERGRTKCMFVTEAYMAHYRDQFDAHNRVQIFYRYNYGDLKDEPIGTWPLWYDRPDYADNWHKGGVRWEDAACLQMQEVNQKIQSNEIRNFRYIGKNPNELAEDEIVMTFLNYHNPKNSQEEWDLKESMLISAVVHAIQQQKGENYNVSRQEMLNYIAHNAVECDLQFHTTRYPEVYAGNWVTVTKPMKIVGVVFADWESEDYYSANPDFEQQFIYSDKLDMLEVAFNNYGLIGYVANLGSDPAKDKLLLDYCEANDLDYNGIMNPYLEDADNRARYLMQIGSVLTLIFAGISGIILINLMLTCMQKTSRQVSLLRALGSSLTDTVGVYLLQGILCGILVAVVAMLLFPLMIHLCASGSGLGILEPIFKGVGDLMGGYSPYLDRMIRILPTHVGGYVAIGVASVFVTALFTVLPFLFKMRRTPMEFLRAEGDL